MKTKSEIVKKNAVNVSKDNLEDIFEDLLKDIYWAEKHLVKAIPKMAKASYNEELKRAFEEHVDQTQRHVQRIENCFELLKEKAVAKKCDAMDGLIKEGADAIESYDPGHARDAALIAAAQKVEHYEISAYGTLRTMATVLGRAIVRRYWKKQNRKKHKPTPSLLDCRNDKQYATGWRLKKYNCVSVSM
jgi:ferritin-like metal-binding protein YciE